MKTFNFSVFALLLCQSVYAQLPVQFEKKYFPERRRNVLHKTLITNDDAYLAVGEKENNVGGYDQDLAIIKINNNGGQEWQIIYDDNFDWACGYDAGEYENGELIILGEIKEFSGKDKMSLILIKLTANGRMLWRKKHSLPQKHRLRKIAVLSPDMLLLVGEDSRRNHYFVHLDNAGEIVDEFYMDNKTLRDSIYNSIIRLSDSLRE